MQEVIGKCRELYGLLVVKHAEVDKEKTSLLTEEKALKDKRAEVEAFGKELTKREAAVSVIENVKALSDETAEKMKQVKNDHGQLVIERNAFESYQAQTKEENQKLTNDLNLLVENNKTMAADLEARIKELEERKKNLKAEVISELQAMK